MSEPSQKRHIKHKVLYKEVQLFIKEFRNRKIKMIVGTGRLWTWFYFIYTLNLTEVQHDGLSTASAWRVECVGCGESMRRETRERCLKIGENLEEK